MTMNNLAHLLPQPIREANSRTWTAMLAIALLALFPTILSVNAAVAQSSYSTISVSPSTVTVLEGDSVALTLTKSGSQGGFVNVSTVNGVATGTDFGDFSVSPSVFKNQINLFGASSGTVTLPITKDYIVEGDETFQIHLSVNPSGSLRFPDGSDAGNDPDTTLTVNVTITEPDKYAVSFGANPQSAEGGTLNFTVNVENAGSGTFDYAIAADSTADSGDYTFAEGKLTVNANSAATTSYTISVPTIDDTLVEVRESVTLQLSNPTGTLAFPDENHDGTRETTISLTGFITDNETPLWAEVSDANVMEGGEARITITLERALKAGEAVTFFGTASGGNNLAGPSDACWPTNPGHAQVDFDYQPVETLVYTMRGGERSVAMAIPTVQDNLHEADECFYVRFNAWRGVKFRAQTGQAGRVSNILMLAKVTITNDDDAPELHYGRPEALEPDPIYRNNVLETATLRFPIILTRPSGQQVTVDYAPVSGAAGDATPGNDYTAIPPGTLTFAPGETKKVIDVEVKGDWIEEADELVRLRFSNAVNACLIPANDCKGQNGSITIAGTILNEDRNLAITIEPDDDRVREGEDIVFRVKLSHPIPYPVVIDTVGFGGTATAGDDYDNYAAGFFGIVETIHAGQTERTITVPTLTDNVADEGHETVTLKLDRVRLGPITSGGYGANHARHAAKIFGSTTHENALADRIPIATAYILDGPVLSITPEREEVAEGHSLDFTVALSEPASQDVTFTIKSQDGGAGATGAAVAAAGADYTALAPQQVIINAGRTDGGTFTINALQDTADEPDHMFSVLLESVTGPVLVDEGKAVGVIRDDDPRPLLSISDAVTDEGGSLTFTLTLTGATERTVTTRWVTEDVTATHGRDYIGVERFQTVTFAPGDTSKMITLDTFPDSEPEVDETFWIQLVDAPAARFQDATGVGTIRDDDGVILSIADAVPVTETKGSTPQATFTITLTPAQTKAVTVQWQTMDGTGGDYEVAMSGGTTGNGEKDYTAVAATSITFAPGETIKQVSTTVLDDETPEIDENFRAVISVSDPDIMLARATAYATIVDDDAWNIWLDESNPTWIEEGTGENKVVTIKMQRTNVYDEESTVPERFHGTDFWWIGCFVTEIPNVLVPPFFRLDDPRKYKSEAHVPDDVSYYESEHPTVTRNSPECHERQDGAQFTIESFEWLEYEHSFQFLVKGDSRAEGNEEFTFLLQTVFVYSRGFNQGSLRLDPISRTEYMFVTMTIVDDDSPQASIADLDVVEDEGVAKLTVNLSMASTKNHSVKVSLTNGTALAWEDYQPRTDYEVRIPAGKTSGTIDIPIVDDDLLEGSETFTATLSDPSDGLNIHPAGKSATITITDDNDDSHPRLTMPDRVIDEGFFGDLLFNFSPPVRENAAWQSDIQWHDETPDGLVAATEVDDYATITGAIADAVRVVPGDTHVTATVQTVQDTLIEEDEYIGFSITWRNADGLEPNFNGRQALVAIRDDDLGSVGFGAIAAATVDENVEWTSSTPTTSGNPFGDVSWSVEGDDAALFEIDYDTGVLTLPAQNFEDPKDQDGDNVYSITVRATDEDGNTATRTAQVTVTDVTYAVINVSVDRCCHTDAALQTYGAVEGEGIQVSVHPTFNRATPVSVTWATAYDSAQNANKATADTDYTASTTPTTLSWAQTTASTGAVKTFTIATTEDTLAENNETFLLRFADGVAGTTDDVTFNFQNAGATTIRSTHNAAEAALTIADDEGLPKLTISDASIAEGGKAQFTVTLSAASVQDVTFQWTTGDDTAQGARRAKADTDYTAVTTAQTVTISAGSRTATIEVQTTQDTRDEYDETFVVTLASPSNATLGTPFTGTGTITDDDAPPSVTISDASVAEGGTAQFTASLSAVSGKTVIIQWTTGDDTSQNANQATAGTDYTAATTTQIAVLPPGARTSIIHVQTTADMMNERDETFVVTLASPVNATLGATASGTGTITDDDPAPTTASLSVSPASVGEDAGATTVTVTATLGGTTTFATDKTVTVTVGKDGDTAESGVDYSAVGDVTITLGAGTRFAQKTFTLTPTNDSLNEPDETITLHATAPALTISDIAMTITNDDALPALTIGDASVAEGDKARFTVTLGALSGRDVTVQWTTGDDPAQGANQATANTDYTAVTTAQTLTIAAGSTTATIEVQTTADVVDETDETFVVTLSSPTKATLGTPSTGTGTITHGALPRLTIGDATATEGGKAKFTVTLNRASTQDITVQWTTGDDPAPNSNQAIADTDYLAQSSAATLTISAGNKTGTIEVQTRQDTLDEYAETFMVTLDSPTNAVLGGIAAGTGTITDDDAPPTLTIGNASVSEGWAAEFKVRLSAVSAKDVTVQWTTGDDPAVGANQATANVDYTAVTTARTLTLPAGSLTGAITVQTTIDSIDENNETFIVDLSSPTNASLGSPATGTGTIRLLHIVANLGDGLTSSLNNTEIPENIQTAPTFTFSVTLDGAPITNDHDLTVKVGKAGDSAVSGLDYTTVDDFTITLTSGTNTASGTFTLDPIDDNLDEDDETVTIYTEFYGVESTATLTIIDDDGKPVVTVGNSLTVEGDLANFRVTLDRPSTQDVTVRWSTGDNPADGASQATGGADYETSSGQTLTFPAGSTTAVIEVLTKQDAIEEADETFIITLSSPTRATLGSSIIGTALIGDDDGSHDRPRVNLTAVYAAAEHDPGGFRLPAKAHFQVTLSEPLEKDVWIPIDLEYISAEEEACHTSAGTTWCGPELAPGRDLVGPWFEGVNVSDCSADSFPSRASFVGMCLSYPYRETAETKARQEQFIRGNFINDPRPYLVPIKAGHTVGGGSILIRVDTDIHNEKFTIYLATAHNPDADYQWPLDAVLPGDKTEADVFIVDTAVYPTAASWWDELSGDQRRQMLSTDGLSSDASSVNLKTQLDGIQHLVPQYASESFDDTHPEFVTVIGALAGELVDAEMDALRKRVDLSSAEAWWGDLDCRLRRVAVGEGISEDTSSSWCKEWPVNEQSNDPAELSSEHTGIVETIFEGLLDNGAVGNVNDPPLTRQRGEAPGPEVSVTAGSHATEGDLITFMLTAYPAPLADLDVSVSVTTVGDFGVSPSTQTVTIPASGTAFLDLPTTDDNKDEPDGSVTAAIDAGTGYSVSFTAGTVTVVVSDDDDPSAAACTPQLPDDAVTVEEVTGWRDKYSHKADHVKRWNKVLAALGVENTGETAMTSAESKANEARFIPGRWDRVTRTLQALEQCAATAAEPEISVTAGNDVTEGNDATFTITANPAPTANLDVSVTVSQSGDYGVTTGAQTVTIPTTGSYTLTVATSDDAQDEADGSVTATVDTGTGYTVSGTAGAATVAVADDDVPEISVMAGNGVTEGVDATFTITANPVPHAALTVSVTVSQSGDYGVVTGSQMVNMTTTGSYTLTVTTSDDSVDETDGSVTTTVNAGTGYTVSGTAGAATVVVADDDPSAAQAPACTPDLPEDAVTVEEVTAWRDKYSHKADHVKRWNKVLAALGVEGTGETPMTIAESKENEQRFIPGLWNRVTRTLEALEQCDGSTGSDEEQSETQQDPPPPPPADPEVSITSGSAVTEGGDAAFTITAKPAPASALSVSVSVSQSGDYGVSTGSQTISIPTSGSYTLTVSTRDDSQDEADGSVTATVDDGTGYTVSSNNGAATVAVADDDDPTPVPAEPEVSITAEGAVTEGGDASFTITANPAPTSALTVIVTISQSGDYGVATGSQTVTIPTTGSYILTVNTTGDSLDEADGSVTATIDSGDGYTVSSSSGAATVAVSDDDVPEISISGGNGITEGGDATFTLTANPAPHAALPVSVSVSQSGDYGASTGAQTVTIPTTGSYTLTVSTSDDAQDEANGSVTATLNTGNGYTVSSSSGTSTVSVSDDDDPPPPPADPEVSITAGGAVTEGGNATFTITANPAPTSALTVTVSVSQSGDYGVTTGSQTVTIPTTGSYTLPVSTSDDAQDEANGSVTATLNTGNGYTVSSSNGAATVNLYDDDPTPAPSNPVTVSVEDAAGAEGDAQGLRFVVTLSEASDQVVTLGYGVFDGSAVLGEDFNRTPYETFTLDPGETTYEIVLPIIDDAVSEQTETLTLFLYALSGATIPDYFLYATGTIEDND